MGAIESVPEHSIHEFTVKVHFNFIFGDFHDILHNTLNKIPKLGVFVFA